MVASDSDRLESILAGLPVLFSALELEALQFSELRRCADRMIEQLDSLPIWLVDLDSSKDIKSALAAISVALHETGKWSIENDLRIGLLGFLHMKYKSGKISLVGLLIEAGTEVDGANLSNPSCEVFYQLMNRLEDAKSDAEKAAISIAAEEILKPFSDRLQAYIYDNKFLKDVKFLA